MIVYDPKTKKNIEYHMHLEKKERLYILTLLCKKNTGLSTFRRLMAMRTLLKNTVSHAQLQRLTDDANFVKEYAQKEGCWD
jgi:hypothetical protein